MLLSRCIHQSSGHSLAVCPKVAQQPCAALRSGPAAELCPAGCDEGPDCIEEQQRARLHCLADSSTRLMLTGAGPGRRRAAGDPLAIGDFLGRWSPSWQRDIRPLQRLRNGPASASTALRARAASKDSYQDKHRPMSPVTFHLASRIESNRIYHVDRQMRQDGALRACSRLSNVRIP